MILVQKSNDLVFMIKVAIFMTKMYLFIIFSQEN